MIVRTDDKHYGDIADAIRDKLGTTDGYKPEDMAAAVGDIESGGGNYQSKSVTYTSNGTDTVTPDAGYDALSEVNVTVDVSGGGDGTLKLLLFEDRSYEMEVSNIVFEQVRFRGCTIYLSGNAVLTMCDILYSAVWCSQSTYDSIFDPLNFNNVDEDSTISIW